MRRLPFRKKHSREGAALYRVSGPPIRMMRAGDQNTLIFRYFFGFLRISSMSARVSRTVPTISW